MRHSVMPHLDLSDLEIHRTAYDTIFDHRFSLGFPPLLHEQKNRPIAVPSGYVALRFGPTAAGKAAVRDEPSSYRTLFPRCRVLSPGRMQGFADDALELEDEMVEVDEQEQSVNPILKEMTHKTNLRHSSSGTKTLLSAQTRGDL